MSMMTTHSMLCIEITTNYTTFLFFAAFNTEIMRHNNRDMKKRLRFKGGDAIADEIKALTEQKLKYLDKLETLRLKKDSLKMQKSAETFKKISSFFRGVFGVLWEGYAPYIVLISIFFIFFLIAIVPNMKNAPGRVLPTTGLDKVKKLFKTLLDKVFPADTIRRWFNPFGKVETFPRTQNAGRCDNLEWREYVDPSEPYGGGVCKRTYSPKPYVWNIDTSKLPDLAKMPQKAYDQVTHNGKKLQVFIPYEQQSTFYVPQCDKAYYLDENNNQVVLRDVDQQLLVDNGLTCSLKERPAQSFHARYRKVNGKPHELSSCTV